MEARSEQGLRGRALSTLEAMVVSMGRAFTEAGADEPDTTQEDVRGTRGRHAAEEQPGRGVPE